MKSIGFASRESGVGIEAIRYYERDGIVPDAQRAPNGRRLYSDQDILRLKFIKRYRSLGFPISDIRNLQQLAFSSENSCEEAAVIGRRNLEVVQEKIAELEGMERALMDLVRRCEEKPNRCPMLKEWQADEDS